MNVFQLGIRSVVRKPVKSMLLLLIVFVSASFIYAGFACQNASQRESIAFQSNQERGIL